MCYYVSWVGVLEWGEEYEALRFDVLNGGRNGKEVCEISEVEGGSLRYCDEGWVLGVIEKGNERQGKRKGTGKKCIVIGSIYVGRLGDMMS